MPYRVTRKSFSVKNNFSVPKPSEQEETKKIEEITPLKKEVEPAKPKKLSELVAELELYQETTDPIFKENSNKIGILEDKIKQLENQSKSYKEDANEWKKNYDINKWKLINFVDKYELAKSDIENNNAILGISGFILVCSIGWIGIWGQGLTALLKCFTVGE